MVPVARDFHSQATSNVSKARWFFSSSGCSNLHDAYFSVLNTRRMRKDLSSYETDDICLVMSSDKKFFYHAMFWPCSRRNFHPTKGAGLHFMLILNYKGGISSRYCNYLVWMFRPVLALCTTVTCNVQKLNMLLSATWSNPFRCLYILCCGFRLRCLIALKFMWTKCPVKLLQEVV